MLRTMLVALALTFVACSVAPAQSSQQPNSTIAEFFKGITGEWVGVCKQSTDGETADDKYFHAHVVETNPGLFTVNFEYYRLDSTGNLVRIGTSTVTAMISSSGYTATGNITGDGEVLVDNKPKKQQHDLTECLTTAGDGSIQANGSGTLKVLGMPLGLGKLGKVREDKSTWTLTNDKLSITQNLSIVFRALCFSKGFRVDAKYNAIRGSDVMSQVLKRDPVTAKAEDKVESKPSTPSR